MGPKVNRFWHIHLRSCAGILWVLRKMFEWICLFPADVALCAKLFGYMEVDDSEMFLDTDTLPHVHCHWHNRRRSERLPSQKTCSLWPPSWIKYKSSGAAALQGFGRQSGRRQIQVPTSIVPSWVYLATAFMVPLSVHATLLTHYPLDMSYCIPFRSLSITYSSVFLDDHSIYRNFYTAVDISEPVHFWTHVDKNFFA